MSSEPKKIIKVMLVDDSAVVRQGLSEVLNSDPEIEVVEACHDPFIAAKKLKNFKPDVMMLDVERCLEWMV